MVVVERPVAFTAISTKKRGQRRGHNVEQAQQSAFGACHAGVFDRTEDAEHEHQYGKCHPGAQDEAAQEQGHVYGA